LPQQFYYFFAYKQWRDKKNLPVISVPSGNFGNICAGILANRSGLPVDHFIAACNVNDIVSDYLLTGNLKPKTSKSTLSNAMDVGNPSNFIRILEIFEHKFPELKEILSSSSISDEETLSTIKQVFEQYHYTLDPHGAVGYLSLKRYLQQHKNKKGIFLETAHPVKFPDAVEKATSEKITIPQSIASIMNLEKNVVKMKTDYPSFRDYLLQ
jgi:threonine synthase